jgi:ClpX C4-type zinc finger
MWFRPKSGHTNPRKNVLFCSFCGKDQNDAQKLIAGPTVFICNECVDVCVQIIAEDTRFQMSARRQMSATCTFCGNIATDALSIPDRGILCGDCAEAIEEVLSSGRPTSGSDH